MQRSLPLFVALACANLGAWAWALALFGGRPALMGMALLAYGLGLRHAVDADHIAAIDNVTRKLVEDGQRPVAVGFFFALGHSSVVVAASAGIAAGAAAFAGRLDWIRDAGGTLGTAISALFLFGIAAVNLAALRTVWVRLRRSRRGEADGGDAGPLAGGGLLARLLRPLLRMIGRSWHMLPLGFLFGLGFDTATEVAVLGISATQATRGLPVWSIMAFPALFAAGMALVDTIDGVMMLGAYEWAFVRPARKRYYNLTVTAASVLVAAAVGGIELLGLVGDRLSLRGRLWQAVGAINGHFGTVGFFVIGFFAAAWGASVLLWRHRAPGRAG